jgi:hypothetical protein
MLTQLGGSTPEGIARILMREIANDQKDVA